MVTRLILSPFHFTCFKLKQSVYKRIVYIWTKHGFLIYSTTITNHMHCNLVPRNFRLLCNYKNCEINKPLEIILKYLSGSRSDYQITSATVFCWCLDYFCVTRPSCYVSVCGILCSTISISRDGAIGEPRCSLSWSVAQHHWRYHHPQRAVKTLLVTIADLICAVYKIQVVLTFCWYIRLVVQYWFVLFLFFCWLNDLFSVFWLLVIIYGISVWIYKM